MSSDAHLSYDEGGEVTLDQWERFAADHELTYDPHVVGQNTYRHARLPVQVRFGDDGYRPESGPGPIDFSLCKPPAEANRIVFTTYFRDAACVDVAALAVAAWQEFDGDLSADPEIRGLIRAVNA